LKKQNAITSFIDIYERNSTVIKLLKYRVGHLYYVTLTCLYAKSIMSFFHTNFSLPKFLKFSFLTLHNCKNSMLTME